MTEVTDVLVARMREPDALGRTLGWSAGAHLALVIFLVFMPQSWLGHIDEGPRTVMTISLGGAPGPRAGGMTPMGGRTIQETAVEPPKVETAPAPKPPPMTLPTKNQRIQPRPKRAAQDATARKPTTGDVPREGSTRTETGARGQGFGLTTGGGGGTGATLDVGNFCCPEYLEQMMQLIQRNWSSNQSLTGTTVMKFTIERSGTINNVQIERPSGFVALDLAAQRALLLTRLPELPVAFPNPTLTVHMRFEYQQ
jgi:TonB family protein